MSLEVEVEVREEILPSAAAPPPLASLFHRHERQFVNLMQKKGGAATSNKGAGGYTESSDLLVHSKDRGLFFCPSKACSVQSPRIAQKKDELIGRRTPYRNRNRNQEPGPILPAFLFRHGHTAGPMGG